MFHVRSHDAEVFAQRDRERFFKRRWRLSRQIKMLVTSVHTRDKHVELGHRINRIGDNTGRQVSSPLDIVQHRLATLFQSEESRSVVAFILRRLEP